MGGDYRVDSQEQRLPDVFAAWRYMGAAAQIADPLLKGVMHCNLELVGLASRRAQAYLDVPSTLQRCRSPQDLATENVRFWQTAVQQYAESGHSIMRAWTAALAAGLRNGENSEFIERDYFKFAESRADAEPAEGRKQAARRAA